MTVLVVGATGVVGPHGVAALTARGVATRVLARDAERARRLLPSSVDVRAGDPGSDDDLLAAADGLESLFLLTSQAHQMAGLQLRIIRALRRTGVRIVKLSGTSSAIIPDGPHACRQHWEIEQVLAASGQPHVLLRPNAFMQTLIDQIMLPAVAATGAIPNPIAGAGINFVDARDVGDCVARLLTDASFDGQTLVLTGPSPVRFAEIAELIRINSVQHVTTIETTRLRCGPTLNSVGWPVGRPSISTRGTSCSARVPPNSSPTTSNACWVAHRARSRTTSPPIPASRTPLAPTPPRPLRSNCHRTEGGQRPMTEMSRTADCLICDLERAEQASVVFRDELWAAETVAGFEVPGWFFLRVRRHAERLTGLNGAELATFGQRARDLVAAVTEVTGAPATYLFVFGENYPHFHAVITARGEHIPENRRSGDILKLRADHADSAAAARLVPAVRHAYEQIALTASPAEAAR